MKNPFESFQDSAGENLSGTEEFRIEKIRKNLEESAEVDLRQLEESDDSFIEQEKKKHNIKEDDPRLESRIAAVKEKHEAVRDGLKSTLLSKLRRVSKYAAGSMIALSHRSCCQAGIPGLP